MSLTVTLVANEFNNVPRRTKRIKNLYMRKMLLLHSRYNFPRLIITVVLVGARGFWKRYEALSRPITADVRVQILSRNIFRHGLSNRNICSIIRHVLIKLFNINDILQFTHRSTLYKGDSIFFAKNEW